MPACLGAEVQAYYNRTRHIWSVRQAGIVVDRRPSMVLAECVLHVGESARQRVLRTGDRDVHAWVLGTLADLAMPPDVVRIGYRPTEPGFRRRDTGEVVTAAAAVFFLEDGSCHASL
ncbi:hypothetical protein [uncultured Methylobacterium sp.]|uniref:hypothetical protein n=1 Tax=uncultured Methylobacterium sp. TaxID=157278 RepID=UPI0035C9F18E